MLILVVTLFSLFISFQITSNSYKDNKKYREAHFLMDKHPLDLHEKSIENDMYYLVDSPKWSRCTENGKSKYYLLDKKKYTVHEKNSVLKHDKFNLVSCKVAPMSSLGVVHEKGFYLQKERTLERFLQTYKTTVGGTEPLYMVLSYIFSSVLEYDYFILLMNIFFLSVVFLALKKFTKHYKYMYILLVLSDFYLYIYLSNTHRLKLAIMFLLLSYLTHNKTKIIMIIGAILSHLQILILYLYTLLLSLIEDFRSASILSKMKTYGLYTLLALAFALFFQDQIIAKVTYYLQLEIPYKVAALILMYLIYLFVFKLEDTIKLFVPLAIMVIVISFFIGSNRVNFLLMEFILIVELNRLLDKNKNALFVVVPFILYSIYKSVNYIQQGIS